MQNQAGSHPTRWDKTGTITEVLDHGQYMVRLDGSGRCTLRNRRFLCGILPVCTDQPQRRWSPSPPLLTETMPTTSPITIDLVLTGTPSLRTAPDLSTEASEDAIRSAPVTEENTALTAPPPPESPVADQVDRAPQAP